MTKLKSINNKNGLSLVFVILVMLVLTILSTAVFTLFVSNMNQARLQENATRAHYVAISGVELTFAALTQGTTSTRLLNTHFNKPIDQSVSDLTETIVLSEGSASVTISSYVEDGNRWVKIVSIGSLTDGTIVSKKIEMKFRADYPEIQIWS